MPFAAQRLGRIESADGLFGLPGFCKIAGTQEGHFIRGGGRRGSVDESARLLQIAAGFRQLCPGREGLGIVGRELVGALETGIGVIQSPLPGQVVAQVRQHDGLHGRPRRTDFQGLPQVPFTGDQVAAIGQEGTEYVMGLGIPGIRAQGVTRHLLGIGRFAVVEEKLDQLVVRPVGPRVDSDHGIERTCRLAELTPMLLDLETNLERVDVAAGCLQAFFNSLFRGFDFTTRECLAGTQYQGMNVFSHEREPRHRADGVAKTRYGATLRRSLRC